MRVIDRFDGEYNFLSNFSDSPMKLNLGSLGTWSVLNVEEVFQAAKAVDDKDAIWVLQAGRPGMAKRRGRAIRKRDDWDEIKIDVMRMYVTAKFVQNPDLAQKLLDTGDAILIEGNTWGDRFWGTVNGEGENWLGKILMEVRDGLSDGSLD